MGVLVVPYNFMLECSYRADPFVKKGEEKGKITMIKRKQEGGEIAYLKNSFQS